MKLKKNKIMIAAAGLVTCAAAKLLLTNSIIKTTEYKLTSDKIKKNKNIVQISDLHNYSFGKDNRYLIEKIKKTDPDVIIITGDLVDAHFPDFDKCISLCKRLINICPVLYSEGNHENYLKYNNTKKYYDYLKELKNIGVSVLEDDAVCIEDIKFIGTTEDTQEIKTNKDIYNITLTHNPRDGIKLVKYKPELILSGHTHGGQIYIPGIGRIFTHGQGINADYISGKWDVEDTTMIINNGLGSSRIHPVRVRVNVLPEIIKLTIQKSG